MRCELWNAGAVATGNAISSVSSNTIDLRGGRARPYLGLGRRFIEAASIRVDVVTGCWTRGPGARQAVARMGCARLGGRRRRLCRALERREDDGGNVSSLGPTAGRH